MPWTAPHTFVALEVPTAAQWNAWTSDDLSYLYARIQSGSRVATTSLGGDIFVTFPTAFATPPIVNCTAGDAALGFYNLQIVDPLTSASGFEVRAFDAAGAPVVSVSIRVNWIAFAA